MDFRLSMTYETMLDFGHWEALQQRRFSAWMHGVG